MKTLGIAFAFILSITSFAWANGPSTGLDESLNDNEIQMQQEDELIEPDSYDESSMEAKEKKIKEDIEYQEQRDMDDGHMDDTIDERDENVEEVEEF